MIIYIIILDRWFWTRKGNPSVRESPMLVLHPCLSHFMKSQPFYEICNSTFILFSATRSRTSSLLKWSFVEQNLFTSLSVSSKLSGKNMNTLPDGFFHLLIGCSLVNFPWSISPGQLHESFPPSPPPLHHCPSFPCYGVDVEISHLNVKEGQMLVSPVIRICDEFQVRKSFLVCCKVQAQALEILRIPSSQ
jgi:hypothetical protein